MLSSPCLSRVETLEAGCVCVCGHRRSLSRATQQGAPRGVARHGCPGDVARAGDVTGRPVQVQVQRPWTGPPVLSPRRGCPAAGPPQCVADPDQLVDAAMRSRQAARATPPCPGWPPRQAASTWARCVRQAPRVSGSGPTRRNRHRRPLIFFFVCLNDDEI